MRFLSFKYLNILTIAAILSFLCNAVAHAIALRITAPQNQKTVSGMTDINAVLACNKNRKNLSYFETDELFNKYSSTYSPALIKAIAWQESRWNHYSEMGDSYGSNNFKVKNSHKILDSTDWGIMQINDKSNPLDLKQAEMEKVKSDTEYCIQKGIAILDRKQEYLEYLKVQSNWSAIQSKYNLAGHNDQDLLLKAYNGFIKSWNYAESVNAYLISKPWERSVSVSCLIDKTLINQQMTRLIDLYQYSWDSTSTTDGEHQIIVQIPQETEDQINVQVMNQDENSIGEGQLNGQVISTTSVISFDIQFRNLRYLETTPPPVIDQNTALRRAQSIEMMKKMGVTEETINNLETGGRARTDVPIASKIIEGTALITLNIRQTSTEYGILRVSNPYSLQSRANITCNDYQMVNEYNKFMIGLALGKKPSYNVTDASGNSGLAIDISLSGRQDGKDIEVYFRRRQDAYISGQGENGVVSGISDQEEKSYFSVQGLLKIPVVVKGFYDKESGLLSMTLEKSQAAQEISDFIGAKVRIISIRGGGSIQFKK